MSNEQIIDLAERVGWTILQGAAGVIAADEVTTSLGTADWRAIVVGGVVAGLTAVLKVLGVNAAAAVERRRQAAE